MRIYQYPPDEQELSNYLQDQKFDKAIEIVDWYYSPRNSKGFDDPTEVIKGKDITPRKKVKVNSIGTINIRKSKGQWILYLAFLSLVLSFFIYLSADSGSLTLIIYSGPIIGVLIILVMAQLIDKKSQVTLTSKTLEFKKSNKEPIQWDNILTVYLYSRHAGKFNTNFIFLWKKDSVKPEQFIVDYLEFDPETICYLIESFKNEKQKPIV